MSDSVREGGGWEEAEYALRPGEGPARCKLKQEREKGKETSGVKWIWHQQKMQKLGQLWSCNCLTWFHTNFAYCRIL